MRDFDFDYARIDEAIHGSRLRIALMSLLASVESAEFTFLRDMTKSTGGNVCIHLRKLEEVGYVKSTKRAVGLRYVTDYALTSKGRKAFAEYVEYLLELVGKGDSGRHT